MSKKKQKLPETGVQIEMTDGSFATVDEDNAAYISQFVWFPVKIDGNMHAGRMATEEDGKDYKNKIVLMEHEVIRLMTPARRKKMMEESRAYEKEEERKAFLRQPLKKTFGGNA